MDEIMTTREILADIYIKLKDVPLNMQDYFKRMTSNNIAQTIINNCLPEEFQFDVTSARMLASGDISIRGELEDELLDGEYEEKHLIFPHKYINNPKMFIKHLITETRRAQFGLKPNKIFV